LNSSSAAEVPTKHGISEQLAISCEPSVLVREPLSVTVVRQRGKRSAIQSGKTVLELFRNSPRNRCADRDTAFIVEVDDVPCNARTFLDVADVA